MQKKQNWCIIKISSLKSWLDHRRKFPHPEIFFCSQSQAKPRSFHESCGVAHRRCAMLKIKEEDEEFIDQAPPDDESLENIPQGFAELYQYPTSRREVVCQESKLMLGGHVIKPILFDK